MSKFNVYESVEIKRAAHRVAAAYLGLDDEDHENDDEINQLAELFIAFAKTWSEE